MAIIPSIPGITVTINVDNQATQEYDAPDYVTNSVFLENFDLPPYHDGQIAPYIVKYIEATPGKAYEFHIVKEPYFPNRSHHIAYEVGIDGRGTCLMHDETWLNGGNWRWDAHCGYAVTGDPTNRHYAHYFYFAPLKVVDDDQVPSKDLQKQQSLAIECGSLLVALYHMNFSGLGPVSNSSSTPDDKGLDTQGFGEKALKGKAIDCYISYKTYRAAGAASTMWLDNFSDPQKRPFAVFEFRYRTRAGLVREGIIPPLSIRDRVQAMSNAQVRERLIAMMEEKERTAAINKVKSAKNEGNNIRGIKREADSESVEDDELTACYKTRWLDNGRIEVDLTDD